MRYSVVSTQYSEKSNRKDLLQGLTLPLCKKIELIVIRKINCHQKP